MFKKYKTFIEYGIENDIQLDFLPDDMVDMLLDSIITNEIRYIPKNIYNIKKDNLNSFSIKTKLDFIENIEKLYKDEKILIENADILNSLEINDIIINKIDEEYSFYTPTNILFEKLFTEQKGIFNRIISNNIDKSIILAETGSGKTITALSIAEEMFLRKKIHKIIIISERDRNIWIDEMTKHLPLYSMSKYEVTTYFSMYKDVTLKNTNGILFILDEIHLLKNDSKRAKFINSLDIKYFIGLTATLFDKISDLNNLEENLNIENINNIIYKMDSIYHKFNTNIIPIPLAMSEDEMKIFKLSIDKTEIDDIYNKNFENIHKQSQLLSLRSNKLAELFILLEKHKDDKIILFSNYINTVSELEKLIPNCMKIIGGDSKDNIKKSLDIFFYGKFQVLLTTSVLAQSYNLQQANVIIFFDFDLNSIKDMQIEGRIKRIGQEKDIWIYYMYHKNTIEECIFDIINNKKEEYHRYKEMIR